MLRYLVYAVFFILAMLVIVVAVALMIWVVVRVLRSAFPATFSPGKNRDGDNV